MLLIRNQIDHQANWSQDRHQQFLKSCESYIADLKKNGNLIAAQPLVREGKIVSGNAGTWLETPLNEQREVQVGYYHIIAKDLEEATAIAKRNPEFEFSATARIEVRPVKMKEQTTGFVYPKMPSE